MESTSRIPKHSYFYKEREGNLYLGVDAEKEHGEIIREALQSMGGIDVEQTTRSFKELDEFCDCDYCQTVLRFIRPKKRGASA